jgi:pyruvate,water dikinase
MISMAIDAAHRAGKKIGICGQAPSDYPEFALFLVEKGITSISLNPDTVMQTTGLILATEAELAKEAGAKVSLDEAAEILASELKPIYIDEVV